MARCSKAVNGGQSLIEAIVAVGMISVLLVALLALVTLSLKNTRLAKVRGRAVALAQEGVELMRAYRDYDWDEFSGKTGANYHLPANWVVTDGLSQSCPLQPAIDNLFRRCVTLTGLSGSEISAAVKVDWDEGGQNFVTEQATNLSLWER